MMIALRTYGLQSFIMAVQRNNLDFHNGVAARIELLYPPTPCFPDAPRPAPRPSLVQSMFPDADSAAAFVSPAKKSSKTQDSSKTHKAQFQL